MPLWLAIFTGIVCTVAFPPLGIPIAIAIAAIYLDIKKRKEKEK